MTIKFVASVTVRGEEGITISPSPVLANKLNVRTERAVRGNKDWARAEAKSLLKTVRRAWDETQREPFELAEWEAFEPHERVGG